jgi:hypothetical protein
MLRVLFFFYNYCIIQGLCRDISYDLNEYSSNIHSKRFLEPGFNATYQDLLKNVTVPAAMKELITGYDIPKSFIEYMWSDLIAYINYKNPSQWTSALSIYNQVLVLETDDISYIPAFSNDIMSLIKINSNDLNIEALRLILELYGNIFATEKVEYYEYTNDLLVFTMVSYYKHNNNTFAYSDKNFNHAGFLVKAEELERVNITVYQDISSYFNQTSEGSSSILLVSFIFGVQVVVANLVGMDYVQPHQNLTFFIDLPVELDDGNGLCRRLDNATWVGLGCVVTGAFNDHVSIETLNGGIFLVENQCGRTFIPSSIAIAILGFGVLLVILLKRLDSKDLKMVDSRSGSAKSNESSLGPMKTQEGPIKIVKKQRKTFKTYHLILSIFNKDYLEALKNIIIYLSSLLIQLGFTVFIVSTRKESYSTSVLFGLLSGFIGSSASYCIFYFYRTKYGSVKVILYISYALVLVIFTYLIFKNTTLCKNIYWGTSITASFLFDILLMQNLLALSRKLIDSLISIDK